MSEVFSIQQFAAKIKAKYPDYSGIDDQTLVSKMLEKYPQYKDHVSTVGGPPEMMGPPEPPPEPSWADQPISIFGPTIPVKATPRQIGKTARNLAPVAGALGLTAATGGAAALPMIGLATLGGAAGEGLGQLGDVAAGGPPLSPSEAAKKMAIEGAIQGAGEGVGQGVSAGVKGVRAFLKPPPGASKLAKTAAELGLPARAEGAQRLLVENTILGRKTSEKLGKKGLQKASEALAEPAKTLGLVKPPPEIGEITSFPGAAKAAGKDILKQGNQAAEEAFARTNEVTLQNAQADAERSLADIATPKSAEEAGMTVQEGIKTGRDVGGRQAEQLYKHADEINSDKLIDISDFKDEIKAARLRISANPSLRDSTLKGVVDKVLGKPAKAVAKAGEVAKPLGLPDLVTYKQARELQKALGSSVEGAQGQLVSREVKGLSKHLWGRLTDSMESSLGGGASAIDRTVEGGGSAALSAEEVARAGRGEVYYRVSRSGDLTYMGPQPDPAAALRPGEGVVKVSPGKPPMVTQANGPDSEVLARFGKNVAKTPSLIEPPTSGVVRETAQDGLEALRAANAHYREYAQIFKRGHVPKIAKAYPEKVAKLIPDGGITPVKGLREAILGQAERFGTEAEKASAKEAWNTLGETYARQRLLKGGVSQVTKNFETVGQDVIQEMYGATPESRAAIGRLRNIGRQVDVLKEDLVQAVSLNPAQETAIAKSQNVADTVRQSQVAGQAGTSGGIGGLSYHWATTSAAFQLVAGLTGHFKAMGIEAAAGGAMELAGGFTAWAMYRPQVAQTFLRALQGMAHQSPRAAIALGKLVQQYQEEEAQKPTPPPEAP